MDIDAIVKELERSLASAMQKLHEELQAVRSNRPSVQVIEDIPVEVYGQKMTIKQLGSLSVRPPRDVEISVWDKGVMGAVTKAIQDARSGFSASNDGVVVRATLPMLTNERREELMKMVKKTAEQIRIQIRSRRDEANKKVHASEDDGTLTKDQAFRGKERIQKVVDSANAEVDMALEKKLAELAE